MLLRAPASAVRLLSPPRSLQRRLRSSSVGSMAPPEAAAASVFHAGELAVQRKAGVAEQAAQSAPCIRPTMPQQHRAFFSGLMNMLYIGAQDEQGRVWASVLVGQPGFLSSNGSNDLAVAAGAQLPSDPLLGQLAPGAALGALGLDLSTRRRNRVAGSVAAVGASGGLRLRCEQSVGNCPKYIQTRDVQLDPARLARLQRGEAAPGAVTGTGPLADAQLALIRGADTFFLATSGARGGSPAPGGAWPHVGCDVSHRGGPPGFVEPAGDGVSLRWPDYAGNNFFMSLGNIEVNPASGLLFIDWQTGDVLQLSGTCRVAFDDRSLPGAQRVVHFTATAWAWSPAGLPIRPAPVLEASPYNPRPGFDALGTEVECVAVEDAAAGIKTFRFQAPPGMAYKAGQYASFDFQLASGEELNRTWTISSHPSETAATGAFAISVKRAGLVSSLLHDRLRPGGALLLRGVGGDFVVQRSDGSSGVRRALLLAGGIGITPMRTMFLEFMQRGTPATLLYSVRHPQEAAFLTELTALAQSASAKATAAGGCSSSGSPAFRVLATATGGSGAAAGGWRSGRLDAALVAEAAGGDPLAACAAYVCGPTGFMSAATALLEGQGVNPACIYTESFSF